MEENPGRLPLGIKIAGRLRDDILCGRLNPGTPLSQPHVSQRYGTSRMPARDALRQLVSEGLLVETPAGAVVAGFTAADLEDAQALVAIAHARAARRATANATYDELTTLSLLHERLASAHAEGDADVFVETNWQFHRLVNRAARAPQVIAVIRAAALAMPRDFLLAFPELIPAANADKAEIVDAMKAGRGDRAAALMERHVLRGEDKLIVYFAQRGLLSTRPSPRSS